MTASRAKAVTIREEALAAIEGLAELEAAVERAQTFVMPEPVGLVDTFQLLQEAIVAATQTVLDGHTIPADAAQPIVDGIAAVQVPQHYASVVQGVQQHLQTERDQVFASGVGAAFDVLRSHLDRILEEVRSGSKADLQRLVDEYDQVRSTQFSLTNRLVRQHRLDTHRPPNLIATAGLLRDFIDVFAEFQDRRQDSATRSTPTTPNASIYLEWLQAVPLASFDAARATSPWWLTADPASHLTWLAHEGQPWIPTFDEIESAYNAAVIATGIVNGKVTQHQQDARDRYYRLTGARDPYASMPREEYAAPNVWTAPSPYRDRPKPRTWLEQQASA